MQVRSGRAARVADFSDLLPTLDQRADRHQQLRRVRIARHQRIAVIDLDHVAVAAGPAGFDNGAVCRSDDQIAAFAVNIHSRMKLIRPPAKGIAAKAEFLVDLAHVRPNCRQIGGIGIFPEQINLISDLGIFGPRRGKRFRAAAVYGVIFGCGNGCFFNNIQLLRLDRRELHLRHGRGIQRFGENRIFDDPRYADAQGRDAGDHEHTDRGEVDQPL